ncbi:hypothetical protein BT63DRAFT_373661 [Microthyrium microscopicum]|uniref:D-mandelate dehydrogenase n=1 Tax=Microthyrium microscopicum TaxID=703497 RepID=A0A6A6UAT2_9PEZI|nr:hypothetical protein BT63DRAFT_373661 [Microthyrium microscopicum]
MPKPIVLHLGDDIRWNHGLYQELQQSFDIVRSYSMKRPEFIEALKSKKFGDFNAIYRPFWNTGGEMGPFNDELISLLPSSCKIYASAGAGFDWVDTVRLAKNNIIYCNSADACTESAADAALYLILNTFRRFTQSALAARSLDPEQFRVATSSIPAMTHNPAGHVLGVIGMGRIGLRVAQKAYAAFGMKILYYDVVRKPSKLEEEIKATFVNTLDELLAMSDCTLLATPYVGDILVKREHFLKMKEGSRFVNIARGKLVDEDGLIAALESNHLFAAGLDVHFDEPHVNPKLAHMINVEVQCHIGGGSLESHMGFEKLGMENIMSFFKTGQPISPVNMHLIDQSKL